MLLIADLHSVRHHVWQEFLKIDKNLFDMVVLLGDINGLFLKQIRKTFTGKEVLGVLGNHDQKGKFSYYNIEDIHGRIKNINSFKIAGIEGSFKYKDNERFPLYTQSEIIALASSIGEADIIVSHNSPLGIHDEPRDSHIGFEGILRYIEKNSPKYCIHGHQHINKVTKYRDTTIIGVYGASILDLKENLLTKIF